MTLVGQHENAASRCGEVIKTMITTLTDKYIPETDLPSTKTVCRFIKHAGTIGKLQIGETLSNSSHFDLNLDGTTKQGKKYLSHQITTDQGQSLSLGFETVAEENASTLAETATNVLEELSVIYENDPGKRQETFLEYLQKLKGLMTDQAAVMKCLMNR